MWARVCSSHEQQVEGRGAIAPRAPRRLENEHFRGQKVLTLPSHFFRSIPENIRKILKNDGRTGRTLASLQRKPGVSRMALQLHVQETRGS